MNNHEKIKAWLANPVNYNEGLAVYTALSRNSHMVQLLTRRTWMEKLKWEMGKLASGNVKLKAETPPRAFVKKPAKEITPPVKPVVTIGAPVVAPNDDEGATRVTILDGRIRYNGLRDENKKIYDSIRDTYKLMRALHEKMKIATTDDDRANLRHELCSNDDKVRKWWQKLDDLLTG